MAFNHSSCHYQDGLRVLYDGPLQFRRSRTNADVVVALHTNYNCIEIVAFNPTLALKAPRIYLNFSMLKSYLDSVKINEKLREVKEESLGTGKHFSVKDATAIIVRELAVDYIFDRLDMSADSTIENFKVILVPQSGDHKINFNGHTTINSVMECPQLVIPVTVEHKAKLK